MRFHPKFYPHLKSKAVRTTLLKNKTRKRQSEDNNARNKQCKKHKIQNNNTKSQEIISTTKQKLSTQTIINKNNKRRKVDNIKNLIKPEHKLKNYK